jgi:hypothetical protein
MAIEFYNVKKRKKVNIEESNVKKVTYERKTSSGVQIRYAIKAVDDDGTNLTKFCSKETWDTIK